MKTVLAFETSGPLACVALGTREGKIREARSRRPLQHLENLIPLMDRLLKKEKLSLREIDAFAIDRGPGSFTGLRIGFSLLKGLVAGEKKPCYGALSLDIMAVKIRLPEDSRLGVLVDARRERIYGRFYRRRKGEWKAEGGLGLFSVAELAARIRERTTLAGDAFIRYGEPLRRILGSRIHFLQPPEIFPSAATLVQWFQAKDPRLSRLESRRDFLPLYLRASEAEERKREKEHGG